MRVMNHRTSMLVGAFCCLCWGCSKDTADSPQALQSPAGPNSGQSHLAITTSGQVVMSWVESATESATLKFATLNGTGWSEPHTVAQGADWFVNWADFASVTPITETLWAAHWLVRSGPGYLRV